MKIYIQGKKSVSLDPSDFKQGGEAKVWIKGKTVYKIYHQPKHMIPIEKIKELQSIAVDNVILPKDVIMNAMKKPIGITMNKAKGDPLIKLYTTGFQNKNGITNDLVVKLVEMLKGVIQKVHKFKCLIVDINSLNIIVEPSWIVGNFIDVDSLETPNFPATAVNPHVRDWSSKKFTTLTDWYSFAIVTCYLFTGIHPFRGSHINYDRGDVEGRMKDHVSIFNSDVGLPRSVRNFNLIPDHYRKWYIELFENGKRTEPPLLPGTVATISVDVTFIRSNDNFEITFVQGFDNDIVFHKEVFGKEITRTKDALLIDKEKYWVNSGVDVIITALDVIPILAKIQDNSISLMSLENNKKIVYPVMSASKMMIINNSLFIINESTVTELGFTDMRDRIIVSVDSTWQIMPGTHEVFDGIIFQQIMGKPYVVIPIPKSGYQTMYIETEVKELNGYKVVNAKCENGVVVMTGLKNTTYDLFILRFDSDYNNYYCRKITDIDLEEPNFVSLVNGIVVSIFADDSLEIFMRDPAKVKIDKIKDQDIDSTMKLCKAGMEVRFFQGKNLYKIVKK